jgi:hypothetical protein
MTHAGFGTALVVGWIPSCPGTRVGGDDNPLRVGGAQCPFGADGPVLPFDVE